MYIDADSPHRDPKFQSDSGQVGLEVVQQIGSLLDHFTFQVLWYTIVEDRLLQSALSGRSHQRKEDISVSKAQIVEAQAPRTHVWT